MWKHINEGVHPHDLFFKSVNNFACFGKKFEAQTLLVMTILWSYLFALLITLDVYVIKFNVK